MPGENRSCNCSVDPIAFVVKVAIAQQSIDCLDVVLDLGRSATSSAEVSQRELASSEQGIHGSEKRFAAGSMPDDHVIGEPT
jgi:hypothetical protein